MRKTVAMCLFAIAAVAVNAFCGTEGRMSGKITITKGYFSATYDFSDTTHPTKLAN